MINPLRTRERPEKSRSGKRPAGPRPNHAQLVQSGWAGSAPIALLRVADDPLAPRTTLPGTRFAGRAPVSPGGAECDGITVIYMLRFRYDRDKSRVVKQKHGVSLRESQEIFDQAYLVDQKNDDPEQYRAIGWCGGRLCSVIYEIRHDSDGEYYHLITAWKATHEEEQSYAENV